MSLSAISRRSTAPALFRASAAASPRIIFTSLLSSSSKRFKSDSSVLALNLNGNGVGVAQSIKSAPYTIESDTYRSLGGGETAPSPLAYSLASLSGCQQVTGALVAKDLGLKLGKWEVNVEGFLDTAVLVKGVQTENKRKGNWERVVVDVRVESDANEEAFERFRKETERRCPLSQLFIRSGVEWESNWVNVKA